MAKKYRRVQSEFEAFQFVGQGPQEWPEWAKNSLDLRFEITCVWIDNTQGAVRVNNGDWIAQEVGGRLIAFSQKEFAQLFEEGKG